MLRRFHVEQYRSLRSVDLDLSQLTVLVGPNGCGKSNCYKALRLMRSAAEGRLARALAEEGGLRSVLWAGVPKRNKDPRRIRLSIELDHFAFEMACGLPKAGGAYDDPDDRSLQSHGQTLFPDDPELKQERLLALTARRPVVMAERTTDAVRIRDEAGSLQSYGDFLSAGESMLAQLRDPQRFEELALLRETLSEWRFYHSFDTGDAAPMRRPQLRVRTPIIADDGADLASALLTIKDIGDRYILNDVITEGLPGIGGWRISGERLVQLEVSQRIGEREVWFPAHQCSDGTLRFFCLAAALLSPRPPNFLALNEPETSLHEHLLPALTRLLTAAAERSQILLTTHSSRLADLLAEAGGKKIHLRLEAGETVAEA